MNQFDLAGNLPPPAAFKDIANKRPSIAEEKAELALTLGKLCLKAPRSIVNGSIQDVREWTSCQQGALKLLKAKATSVQALRTAISRMELFVQ